MAANKETGVTLLGFAPLFDLDPNSNQGDRISAPFSALWYLVFLLPMFLFTPDRGARRPLGVAVKIGLVEIKETAKIVLKKTGLRNFYLARMIYQDGVNGMLLLGGTFAAGLFKWEITEIGIYGIILNIAAIFSCAVAGFLDEKIGSKRIIIISLILLITANIGIASTTVSSTLFGMELSMEDGGGLFATMAEKAYIIYGLLVGLAFGPIQASSRSYLARSIPPEDAGRYFGLFALVGRATSFMAPLMVATITTVFYSARVGMASLILFFVVGLLILIFTPYPANDDKVEKI
jgi:UMF1 family MFS transporter